MRQLVHVFTAFAIFLHATVGCCAHGEHAVQGMCSKHVDSHDSENHNHAIEEELLADSLADLAIKSVCGHESGQPVPHECCRDKCKWTGSAERDNFDFMLSDLTDCTLCSLVASHVFPQAYGSDTSLFTLNFSLYAMPVRAHLAKCVLLI